MIDSWWHSEAAVTVLFTESALGAEVAVAWTVTFNPSQKPKPLLSLKRQVLCFVAELLAALCGGGDGQGSGAPAFRALGPLNAGDSPHSD